MITPRRPRHAFTMLEVLIALALTLMLAGAVFSFASGLLRSRDTVAEAARGDQGVDALFDRVEEDLITAVAGDPRGGAGVVGTSTDLRLRTRRLTAEGPRPGALRRVSYRFDGPRASVTGSDEEQGPAGVAPVEVCSSVSRVRFRYFDGRAWRAEFDSTQAGALPVAVEISVWSGPPRTEMPGSVLPDRQRVIIIPDGPSAAWREGE